MKPPKIGTLRIKWTHRIVMMRTHLLLPSSDTSALFSSVINPTECIKQF